MLIDLQLHSTYSDGYMKPAALADFVAEQGVKTASLTDHNTVGGLAEFRVACQRAKIKAINGLELYVKLKHKRLNLLWYNFDEHNPELHDMLRKIQANRRSRARNILEKLVDNGFKLDVCKIIDKYDHYIPVNRLADELRRGPDNFRKITKELGENNPREEDIIRHYFFNKNIGLFHESYINIERVFRLRQKIGGQLILNHPGKYGMVSKNIYENLCRLGLDGVETLSPHHSIGSVMSIQHLANRYGLIMTGGSDYHRSEGGKATIQNSFSYFKIDSKFLRGVDKIIG